VLDEHEFGDKVTLSVRRGQDKRDVEITLTGDESGSL
jgi:S1-C subfamily serine protease